VSQPLPRGPSAMLTSSLIGFLNLGTPWARLEGRLGHDSEKHAAEHALGLCPDGRVPVFHAQTKRQSGM